MSARTFVTVLFAGAIALSSASAFAEEAPEAAPAKFGDAGQVALSLNQDIGLRTGDLLAGTGVQFSYFAADHLSIGLGAAVAWSSTPALSPGQPGTDNTNIFLLRAGPRVGYDIPLSSYVSFWPQIGVDLRRFETDSPSFAQAAGSSSTNVAISFAAVAPLVFHPVRGFFIGAGPSFATDFINRQSSNGSGWNDASKTTSIGLLATVGGAF